jgi:Na+/proline symporter
MLTVIHTTTKKNDCHTTQCRIPNSLKTKAFSSSVLLLWFTIIHCITRFCKNCVTVRQNKKKLRNLSWFQMWYWQQWNMVDIHNINLILHAASWFHCLIALWNIYYDCSTKRKNYTRRMICNQVSVIRRQWAVFSFVHIL